MVRYGRTVPKGFLPVFSCDTEADAHDLLVASCATTLEGDFVARELAQEQTLERLYAFSDRLQATWERMSKVREARRPKKGLRGEDPGRKATK